MRMEAASFIDADTGAVVNRCDGEGLHASYTQCDDQVATGVNCQ